MVKPRARVMEYRNLGACRVPSRRQCSAGGRGEV